MSDPTPFSNTTPSRELTTVLLPPWEREGDVISPQTRELVKLVLSCWVQQIVLALGIPGNLLNIAVFAKQGVRERINLLLFSLAIADLSSLLTQGLQKVYCHMDLVSATNWNVLMFPQVIVLNRYFSFVSGCLIVLMTLDRCVAVTQPLKAATLFSYRVMLAAIIFIYSFAFAGFSPILFLFTVDWRYDPTTRRERANLVMAKDYSMDTRIPLLIRNMLETVIRPLSCVIVIICSTITVGALRAATLKRRAMMSGKGYNHVISISGHPRHDTNSQQMSKRLNLSAAEDAVTRMLLFLCVTYVVCLLPEAAGALANYLLPGFFQFGEHHNLFVVCYNIIFAASNLNSTVHFFSYLALSTRFRNTLLCLFPCLRALLVFRRLGKG